MVLDDALLVVSELVTNGVCHSRASGGAIVVRVELADTIVRLEVATDGRDVREEVFFALAGKGWPLLELRVAEMTLEDVFVQLVTEEKAPAKPSREARRAGGGR